MLPVVIQFDDILVLDSVKVGHSARVSLTYKYVVKVLATGVVDSHNTCDFSLHNNLWGSQSVRYSPWLCSMQILSLNPGWKELQGVLDSHTPRRFG